MECSRELNTSLRFRPIIMIFRNTNILTFVWFALFVITACVIYYHALVDVPKRDHIPYMHERILFTSSWDWFWHSISYSRTRLNYPGDYYLFRPAFMSLLAIEDILLRQQHTLIGFISIMTLAISAFWIGRFSALLLGNSLGTLLGLTFLTNFAGMELVLWRHVSFYILAIGLFALACKLICQSEQNVRNKYLATSILLLAIAFHESLGGAALLTVIFFSLVYLIYRIISPIALKNNNSVLKFSILIGAIPVLVYLTVDVVDLFIYPVPSLLGPDRLPPHYIIKSVQSLWITHQAFSTAALFPFFIKLLVKEGCWIWPFNPDSLLLHAVGFLTILLILTGVSPTLKRIYQKKMIIQDIVVIFILSLYLSVIMSMGLGRIMLRSLDYLRNQAPYYYSFASGILCLVVAVCVYNILHSIRNSHAKKYLKGFIGAFLFVLCLTQAFFIHKTLSTASLTVYDYNNFNIYYSKIHNKYYAVPNLITFDITRSIQDSKNNNNPYYFLEAPTLLELERILDSSA